MCALLSLSSMRVLIRNNQLTNTAMGWAISSHVLIITEKTENLSEQVLCQPSLLDALIQTLFHLVVLLCLFILIHVRVQYMIQ